MTELAQELLEGIQYGDYVLVRHGANQIAVEGHIEKWSEHLLYLKRADNTIARIALDDLRALETKMPPAPGPADTASPAAPAAPAAAPVQAPKKETEYLVLRQMAALAPGKTFEFSQDEQIAALRKALKACGSAPVKTALGGVIDSLASSLRSHDLTYKHHNLRAKIIQAWELCEADGDFQVLYWLLGVLAVLSEDYSYALEPLVRARKYALAAYAAVTGKLTSAARILSLCSLLEGQYPAIDQYISEVCAAYRDPQVLKHLLAENKSDPEQCEKIASCAYYLFRASNGKLQRNVTPYDSAFDAAQTLLDAIPADWGCKRSALSYWQEFRGYSYPRMPVARQTPAATMLVGSVKIFSEDRKFGFIKNIHIVDSTEGSPDGKKEIFFHVSQVINDSESGILLRKLLSLGMGEDLEVCFYSGESSTRPGETAATAIELTDTGLADAMARLRSAGQPCQASGRVDAFFPAYGNGRIRASGKDFTFTLNDIADPWLKAYYLHSFSPREQDVTFDISGRCAMNICWKNPSDSDREAYASCVGADKIQQWEQYVENKRQANARFAMPDYDPYAQIAYFDLPDWKPPVTEESTKLLTWSRKFPEDEMPQAPAPAQTPAAKPESPKPAPVQTQIPTTSDFRTLVDQGIKARFGGDMEGAAKCLEKALSAQFEEKALNEYITVLQHIGKVDEALSLLDKHAHQLSESKLVNLRIGLYDKKRDYRALLPLYERAFQLSNTVSSKAHNLNRLIAACVKLEDYEAALANCKKWETFYNQNRHSPDADKMKRAQPYISRHKAYCLFLLGHTEEAREIATTLVRLNPTDEIANRILNGTLGDHIASEGTKTDVEVQGAETFEDLFEEDAIDGSATEEQEASLSPFSRFVRYKIQQTDIASILKSKNIRDGKYVGTIKEGIAEANTLIRRSNISLRAKSENLLAACKLLEQLDDGSPRFTYRMRRISGRAMAVWGDVMVSQARQMDTPRMAYLYTLRVLTPNRQGAEQGWVDSYNRYLRSFFLAQNGQDSLEEYINTQTYTSSRDGFSTEILASGRIPEVLLPEFTVGILLFLDALRKTENHQAVFLEALYNKNPDLRKDICRQLFCLLEKPPVPNVGPLAFNRLLKEGTDLLNQKIAGLNQMLTDISNILMRGPIGREQLDQLNPVLWHNYLTATDEVRLKQIYYIVTRSQDYYSTGDFENRAECLRTVLLEINDLLQAIQAEPTDTSYDIFLPMLNQISLRLADTQLELYQSFLPKLSLEETIPPFRTLSRQVQIQLTIKNGVNYQTADSIEITGITGPEILRYDAPPVIRSLRGGEETEVSLLVTIDRSADASGSFSGTVSCTYKCSDAPQHEITRRQDTDFTFIIRNENFEPLKNPFAAYEEHEMKDSRMFLGRSAQIAQIRDMIRATNGSMNYGRAIGMFGQTRCGKSSLLYHLVNDLKAQYGDDLLIWDLGNIGALSDDDSFMSSFINLILMQSETSIRKNPALRKLAREADLVAPISEVLTNPEYATSYFRNYMTTLNDLLRDQGKMAVLVVDEFTYLHGYIKDGKVSTNFMRFWKALLQNNCIFAIIAGQDDMPEFTREYPNEFACMELMKLNYLAEADTKELIRMPLERENNRTGLFRDDGCIDELYKLTAGSAYLTIILCSKLVTYLNEKGAYMVTRGIIQEFLRTRVLGPNSFLTAKHFEPQIDERGRAELHDINSELLLSVARQSQATGSASLKDITCGALTTGQIQDYLDRLVDRNVLVKEGRDGYWIQVKLLEKWLIDTKGV